MEWEYYKEFCRLLGRSHYHLESDEKGFIWLRDFHSICKEYGGNMDDTKDYLTIVGNRDIKIKSLLDD